MTERPLLRVSATRLRASASSDAAMKDVNLAETNSEAKPPIPMALTVLEIVQQVTKPRGYVSAMLTMVESEARDSRVACSVGSAQMSL